MPTLTHAMLFCFAYILSVFLFRVIATYYALNAAFAPAPHPVINLLRRPFIYAASIEGPCKWLPLVWPLFLLNAGWDLLLVAADALGAVGLPRKRP